MKSTVTTIDEYIAQCPPNVQERLNILWGIIKEKAPEATEKISWGMPTFVYHGNLVHFAAHKHHIGFYPAASGIEAFQQELAEYKSSKGAVQFPMAKPLPLELIRKIVQFRVQENKALAEKKLAEKKPKA